MSLVEGKVLYGKWALVYRRGDLVIKEKVIPDYGQSAAWHEKHIQEVYDQVAAEVRFFSRAFLGFVPRTDMRIGKGILGVSTVLVEQDLVRGQELADLNGGDLDLALMAGFFERVRRVYELFRRMPDLHSRSFFPNPLRAENVVLGDEGPRLVDLEDLGRRWNWVSLRGKVNCLCVAAVINNLPAGRALRPARMVKSPSE